MKFLVIFVFLMSLLCFVVDSKTFLFTRHGQRSPLGVKNNQNLSYYLKYSEVDAQRWSSYHDGDLTEVGVHYLSNKFGNLISRHHFDIYDQYGNCDPQKIEIRSSLSERTILSSLSIIKAFCPKNYRDISYLFVNERLISNGEKKEDIEQLLQSNFSDVFALSPFTRSFHNSTDHLFHGHETHYCPSLGPIKDSIEDTQWYKQIDIRMKEDPNFENVLKYIRQYNPQNAQKHPEKFTKQNFPLDGISKFHTDYLCDLEQGLEVPDLTIEEFSLAEIIHQFTFYNVEFGSDIIKKAGVSEIFKWIVTSLNDDQTELHWYSGHDSNQVAIIGVIIDDREMAILGTKSLPPFGSDLQIQIINEQVNVIFNGIKLRTRFCDNGYDCQVSEMNGFFANYIVDDIFTFCNQQETMFQSVE